MVAEFGQQKWSCTNFRCSDRTLRSRDSIFDFSQEMVKISAGAENWASADFDKSCRYNRPVQYRRDAAHKSRAEILPDAEISTSALVLSYIIRHMNFVFPQQFSAEVFRSNFPQKFSSEVFRGSFPQQFSAEVFRSSFPQKFSAANFHLSFPPEF